MKWPKSIFIWVLVHISVILKCFHIFLMDGLGLSSKGRTYTLIWEPEVNLDTSLPNLSRDETPYIPSIQHGLHFIFVFNSVSLKCYSDFVQNCVYKCFKRFKFCHLYLDRLSSYITVINLWIVKEGPQHRIWTFTWVNRIFSRVALLHSHTELGVRLR